MFRFIKEKFVSKFHKYSGKLLRNKKFCVLLNEWMAWSLSERKRGD